MNWVVLDGEFCRVAEAHARVRAYVKNPNLGLEVPYRYGSEMRRYLPDFVLRVNDGRGDADPLNLIVEIMIQLTAEEWANLKRQIGISSPVGHGGRRTLPYALTEHGVPMLSSVLRSGDSSGRAQLAGQSRGRVAALPAFAWTR